jgi:hypothetical protein
MNRGIWSKVKRRIFLRHNIFIYKDIIQQWEGTEDSREFVFPTIIPNWDHTPRTGKKGSIFHKSTPELFKKHLERTVETIKDKQAEHKIIFLKSWNEWAEGNYVEPDLRFGRAYLEAIKSVIMEE